MNLGQKGGLPAPKAIAFSFRDGGFRHWIRTRHNGSGSVDNAIDFFVNNSATADGLSAPGTGNQHVLNFRGYAPF